MATATFEVKWDEDDGRWHVVDGNGDYYDSADTKDEAERLAAECWEDAEEEAACERLAELSDEVQTLVADCEDEDLLNKIKAMLAGA